MNTKEQFLSIMTACLVGVSLGITIGEIDARQNKPMYHMFPEITSEEYLGLSQSMPERTMVIRFLNAENWQKEKDKINAPANAAGFAEIFKEPCEIVLPTSDYTVLAWPKYGKAVWKDKDAGDNLAHEALHCIRGLWHRDWTAIINERNEEVFQFKIEKKQ